MNHVFFILALQALLGAFDNLWHHEFAARLPHRVTAQRELTLHAVREAIYGVVFIGLAWFEWRGGFAVVLAVLLAAELLITLTDFVEEDRSRRLPAFERVLHTLLTICYGLFLGLFAPVLIEWSRSATALRTITHGPTSWLFTLFGVGVVAWSVRNAVAVLQLRRIARRDASGVSASVDQLADERRVIAPAVLVTGATGFIGTALITRLQSEGARVIALSRDARQAQGLFNKGVLVVERLDALPPETEIDAVVNLAGARVLGRPWTAARRRELLTSRICVTRAVVDLMHRLRRPPRVLVSASAVGYYGAPPDAWTEVSDESSGPRPGEFQSDLCVAIEREARRAERLSTRVVRLRLGVVLGRGDGAYPMLALAARLGFGAVLGSGQQPAPWIHLADAVGLIVESLRSERLRGPVNAVAPHIAPQAEFAAELAASFGRRVRLRVPGAPLRTLAGEMATVLLDGQNAAPHAALAAGYAYRFPTLEAAFRDLAIRTF